MFKQSPSRIQRSKGFKIKHGLQIFLLIAICFWLLYQVKHSHDKKKAFDESLMKLSLKQDREHKTADIGRKGLRTQVDEKGSGDDISEKEEVIEGDEEDTKPEEEEDEENKLAEEEEGEKTRKPEEEKDQSKHGEDEEVNKDDQEEETEEEEENKSEENEEEGEGAGDDLIDEQDQQGDEEETENDVVHEEEKGVDEETEEGRGQEQLAKMENAGSSEDQDHDRNTQEAREENYKRDDASSAVFRETHLETTESDRIHLDVDEKEQADSIEIDKKLEMETKNATMSDENSKLEKAMLGGNVEGNSSVMVKTDKEKGIKWSQISTTISNPDKIPEVGNNSKVEQNRTGMDSGLSQDQNHDMVTSDQSGSNLDTFNQTENSNITSGTAKLDLDSKVSNVTENADVDEAKGSDTSNNGKTLAQGEQTGTYGSADSQNNTSPSAANETNNGTQSGETKSTDSAEEADDSKASLTPKGDTDVIQSATNTSNSNIILEEEKEARIDLGTLPETETEGSNQEDAAL